MKRSLAAVFLFALACAHQPRLEVVDSFREYEAVVRHDGSHRLVNVQDAVPGVVLDIRYATDANFMGTRLYPLAAAFVRQPVASALAAVQDDLAARGLGLKIFDGYRPYAVTVAMWERYRNPDYVADPAKGSRHNRGAAVDLTLVSLSTGRELPMGTGYDDFSRLAGHGALDHPPDVLANRRLLREVMERHGFSALESEWWHYDFRGWEAFPVMDLPLERLAEDESGDPSSTSRN